MHGYRLHEFLEHRLPFVSDLKRATAYRLLEQLLARDLVKREAEREGRRPERQVYRLTRLGQERFATLLREQLGFADRVVYAGNIAILFSDRIPPDERRTLLERRRGAVAKLLAEIQKAIDAHGPGTPSRLALEHDLVHLDAEIDWLDRVSGENL